MKPILALNAFDMKDAAVLGPALEERVRQRARLFGAASVLFYDRPLEFVRGELGLDTLISTAIERGVRARYQRVDPAD